MKKANLLFCLFTVLSFLFLHNAEAQDRLRINFDVGVTNNELDYNLSNRVDSKYSSRWGYTTNLSLEYRFYQSFFISGGASFVQKNFEFERTGAREGWYTKSTNNYISVPVMAGAYLINNPFKEKDAWIKIAGVAYTGYWLSMKRKGQYPVIFELTKEYIFPIS
ncbi:outer membrane beta-barrel protein [Galbibacter pacificus]|uniref:Outer membrane beta-barrel protein n=1 Tax=Galbibacter pacificus TaxID=2996052 RepID=A0ABT6FVK3_9FLAO|nr:outer membrane beta-barrel protein [Galbibacter pacificus]MDG3583788.1 outer membrane beta-barrel protein [Galbibacter pacificus]MDG3587294.1 outer membrane beta-barrel protein [Galbibacter pacificus]